jgi:hypothetical protein
MDCPEFLSLNIPFGRYPSPLYNQNCHKFLMNEFPTLPEEYIEHYFNLYSQLIPTVFCLKQLISIKESITYFGGNPLSPIPKREIINFDIEEDVAFINDVIILKNEEFRKKYSFFLSFLFICIKVFDFANKYEKIIEKYKNNTISKEELNNVLELLPNFHSNNNNNNSLSSTSSNNKTTEGKKEKEKEKEKEEKEKQEKEEKEKEKEKEKDIIYCTHCFCDITDADKSVCCGLFMYVFIISLYGYLCSYLQNHRK